MKDVKPIIAANLAELRKRANLTQAELAARFNYSDKAISRWEQGDTLPDMNVLTELCEFYGVTLDYLVHRGNEKEMRKYTVHTPLAYRLVVSILAVLVVFLVAAVVFAYQLSIHQSAYWMIFVWALPVSCLVAMVVARGWGNRVYNLVLRSTFTWFLLAAVYLHLLAYNFWPLFIIGVPLQAIYILYFFAKHFR